MDYMSTAFGADSASRFPFKAWTNRETNRQTRLNALPTPAAIQLEWVTIFWRLYTSAYLSRHTKLRTGALYYCAASWCAKYCDQHVCTSVCLFVCLSARIFQKPHSKFRHIFCTCYTSPWLSPSLMAMRCVMYFRFYRRHYGFT